MKTRAAIVTRIFAVSLCCLAGPNAIRAQPAAPETHGAPSPAAETAGIGRRSSGNLQMPRTLSHVAGGNAAPPKTQQPHGIAAERSAE